jgi:transposase
MRGQDYNIGAGGQAIGQQSAMFNSQQQNEMAMMMAKQQQELAAANQQMGINQQLNYDEMAMQAAMANAGYNYQSNRQQKAADMAQLSTALGSWASS